MRIGIITEYNPFHLGHAAQLAAVRQRIPDAVIIVAMSGSFVQRGLPAVIDKWTRAAEAVHAGADLVVELPVLSVLRSAESFAAGGIHLLVALGIDALAFGMEQPDALNRLRHIPTSSALRPYLETGCSYGEARTRALAAIDPVAAELTRRPNNLLAGYYLRALHDLAPTAAPMALPRYTAKSAATVLGLPLPAEDRPVSASMIRTHLTDTLPDGLLAADTAAALRTSPARTVPARYEDLALADLRRFTPLLAATYGSFSEGLEHRWYARRHAATLDEFWGAVRTKRIPLARLRRLTAQLLLRITGADLARHDTTPAAWVRPLAMNARGAAVLKHSALPVISKTADAPARLEPSVYRRFAYDLLATDIAALTADAPAARAGGQDYLRHPITVPYA